MLLLLLLSLSLSLLMGKLRIIVVGMADSDLMVLSCNLGASAQNCET